MVSASCTRRGLTSGKEDRLRHDDMSRYEAGLMDYVARREMTMKKHVQYSYPWSSMC